MLSFGDAASVSRMARALPKLPRASLISLVVSSGGRAAAASAALLHCATRVGVNGTGPVIYLRALSTLGPLLGDDALADCAAAVLASIAPASASDDDRELAARLRCAVILVHAASALSECEGLVADFCAVVTERATATVHLRAMGLLCGMFASGVGAGDVRRARRCARCLVAGAIALLDDSPSCGAAVVSDAAAALALAARLSPDSVAAVEAHVHGWLAARASAPPSGWRPQVAVAVAVMRAASCASSVERADAAVVAWSAPLRHEAVLEMSTGGSAATRWLCTLVREAMRAGRWAIVAAILRIDRRDATAATAWLAPLVLAEQSVASAAAADSASVWLDTPIAAYARAVRGKPTSRSARFSRRLRTLQRAMLLREACCDLRCVRGAGGGQLWERLAEISSACLSATVTDSDSCVASDECEMWTALGVLIAAFGFGAASAASSGDADLAALASTLSCRPRDTRDATERLHCVAVALRAGVPSAVASALATLRVERDEGGVPRKRKRGNSNDADRASLQMVQVADVLESALQCALAAPHRWSAVRS